MLREAQTSNWRLCGELSREASREDADGEELVEEADLVEVEEVGEEGGGLVPLTRRRDSATTSVDLFSDLSAAARGRLGAITERLQNKVQAMAVS